MEAVYKIYVFYVKYTFSYNRFPEAETIFLSELLLKEEHSLHLFTKNVLILCHVICIKNI